MTIRCVESDYVCCDAWVLITYVVMLGCMSVKTFSTLALLVHSDLPPAFTILDKMAAIQVNRTLRWAYLTYPLVFLPTLIYEWDS